VSRNWIAVTSEEHVRLGREAGFMQVCHGKAAPLRRVKPGDRVAYYSPTHELGSKDKLQAFTAIGVVKDGQPYQFDMGGGFCPSRRDVMWLPAHEAPIQPLLGVLDFSAGVRNWGYPFRFGIFSASDHDMQIIAAAMGAGFPDESLPDMQPDADSTIANLQGRKGCADTRVRHALSLPLRPA
jgi:hypothetical protein